MDGLTRSASASLLNEIADHGLEVTVVTCHDVARPGDVEMGQEPLAVPIMKRECWGVAQDQGPAIGMLGIYVLQVQRDPGRRRRANHQGLAGETGSDRAMDVTGDQSDDLACGTEDSLQPLYPGFAGQGAHPSYARIDWRMVEDDDRRLVGPFGKLRLEPGGALVADRSAMPAGVERIEHDPAQAAV